ncbi:MAG TPA: pilus assembly protein PilM [Candidatus Omnitrophota bacterium]|nr:pilus assembly protein PilM [Candidatus Omnitrophota bacterium]
MAEEKQVGVFWGNAGLYLVSSAANASKKIFCFPFGENEKIAIKNGPLSTAGLELAYRMKESFKKNHLGDCPVNVALPTRDIIFRSFVIPWMQQSEIKSVVEFEVSKYIPFSLEKLAFAYHSLTFTEHTTRRIRIIFTAIKRDALSNYIRFLEDSSLHIVSMEPASSSLIRALSSKNLIPNDRTIALIEYYENTGRIVVIDSEIPQFVREFHLSSAPPADASEETQEKKLETPVKKITEEIRISLDYFNRQNSQLQVKEALLLAASQSNEISEALKQTLSIPINTIEHESVLPDAPKEEFGFLNAFGTSIIDPVDPALYFNFSEKKAGKGKEKARESLPRKPFNFKSLVKTSLICIPLIIGAIIVSGFLTQRLKKDITTMTEQLGSFQDTEISFIEENKNTIEKKLAYFKNLRTKSDVARLLLLLPDLLPEGTWVESIKIAYDDSASFDFSPGTSAETEKKASATPVELQMTIEGYVYSENQNQQFQLVNRLLKNLKANENFTGFFSKIDLETTRAKTIDDKYPVTSFIVICKNNESQRPQ